MRSRPAATVDPIARCVLIGLKTLAERHHFLGVQIAELSTEIDELVTTANPGLRASHGVGADTAAQLLITAGGNPERLCSEASFAALCGVAPVPASSGRTVRHRLSRGGDRHANNALYRIALVRMSSHQHTRAYVARQVAAGRTKPEIIRLLKRAIAREVPGTSPAPRRYRSTTTCGLPGRPRTSPSPLWPTISVSGPESSPASNAACNATTNSPTSTATGWTPRRPAQRRGSVSSPP